MSASRLPVRLRVISRAARGLLLPRRRDETPRRILVAHHLLLGDTLMLTPLLAKLRGRYPDSEIVMTAARPCCALYQKRPYGVNVHPYDPRDRDTLQALQRIAGFDWAIVPGDNRYSWLARALDACWITAFDGDRPAYKNWPVDERIPYPERPAAWGDMVAELVPGAPPGPYQATDWPAPDCDTFDRPDPPYCVLHVGASSLLKLWPETNWRELATWLTDRGLQVVWSAGPGEQKLVERIDPRRRFPSYAGRLDLAQLWHLLADAALLIAPDTGVAHLGRITGCPTVTLFGPGSAQLYGAGDFWRLSPYIALSDEIACRDQHRLFKREIAWVRRCTRRPGECPQAVCMQRITPHQVIGAAKRLVPALSGS